MLCWWVVLVTTQQFTLSVYKVHSLYETQLSVNEVVIVLLNTYSVYNRLTSVYLIFRVETTAYYRCLGEVLDVTFNLICLMSTVYS